MDLLQNTECNYYIKEVEDMNKKKYNVFCVKNIPLDEKMIKEMEKYDCNVVEFEDEFNQPINNLPSKIKEIIFGYYFNQTIDNLPSGLKKLKFKGDFNQNVDNLPPEIQQLTFGTSFNQLVNNLPYNIQYIAFGYKFNQSLCDNLPPKIQQITFGDEFNQPLCYNLPKLKKLTISKNYNKPLNNLPASVKIIII
jgi:hypothetical protein